MVPVLKPHSERMAVGYLAGRMIEASIMSVSVLFILLQIPLDTEYSHAAASDTSHLKALSAVFAQAQLYAYELGMCAIGLAGLLLCYTFYKAKLVPRWLAVWDFADRQGVRFKGRRAPGARMDSMTFWST